MKFATKIQSIIKWSSRSFYILHIECEDMKHATDMIWLRSAVWYSKKIINFVSTLELFKVTLNKRKSKMLSLTGYVWLRGLLFSFARQINSNTWIPDPPEHLVLLVKAVDVGWWETVSCYRLNRSLKFV